MSSNLDLVDLRILEELKQNARVDAKSLAEKLGVSDRTVARRMKLMEEAGIVKRYTAIIDYDVLMRATNVATLPQKEVEPGHITVEMVELFGMMTTLKRIFGTGMGLILQYIGIGIGRGMASTLPKDMDAAARCILGVQKLNSEGWGFFTTKLDESGSVNAIVLSEGCFFKATKDSEEQLALHILVKGIVVGLFEEIYGNVYLDEVSCLLQGEGRCEFKVTKR